MLLSWMLAGRVPITAKRAGHVIAIPIVYLLLVQSQHLIIVFSNSSTAAADDDDHRLSYSFFSSINFCMLVLLILLSIPRIA
jgi:hypothetical protein